MQVSMFDMAILLWHAHRAAQHPKIGFQNLHETVQEFRVRMERRRLPVHTADLEELLWCANMCDEENEFYHPEGKSFDDIVRSVLKTFWTFDKNLNTITPVNDGNHEGALSGGESRKPRRS